MAFFLSACNTTDALTPQVDVGNGSSSQSTPVTQADAEQLAAQPVGGVEQQPLDDGSNRARSGFGAQNTLQAQAEALQSGNQGRQTSQTQTSQTLREPAEESQQAQATATTSGGPTVRFLPIIGAPVQAVTPLSRQLGAEARARGLTIKSSSDTSSNHILKGYFSALGDGSTVTVIYVWDVLDNAGQRLHRIQGQQTIPSSAADAWSAVPASMMQQIATKTMDEYLSWRQNNGG